uniref:Tyrosine-protein phosphatase non-receptor type 4-like n=1 Tax=Diabrotica virgifera virgifera TaxID=50390 RepID=A0A6P7HHB1_DIAVI
KLVLVVKPNVLYQGYEDFEEPPYQYVPAGENEPSSPGNALQQSMLLLADGLASGALIARYETLFRKHPDLTCDESLKQPNVNKNRYRDILPCRGGQPFRQPGQNSETQFRTGPH